MPSDNVKQGKKRKWDVAADEASPGVKATNTRVALMEHDNALSKSSVRPGALVIWLHGLGDTGEGWTTFKYDVKSDANGESVPENEQFFESVLWCFPTAPIAPVTANDGESMESWFDLQEIPILATTQDCQESYWESVRDMHKTIEEAIEAGTPAHRILVGGFSQGGALALGATLSCRHTLGGAVCFSGWVPGALNGSFAERVTTANKSTPVFWGHGAADHIVLPACQEIGCKLLRAQQVPVLSARYPNLGHEACTDEYSDLLRWLKTLTWNGLV